MINVNGQQIDRMRKKYSKILASLLTFNLNKGTYRPYKKPSDLLSYINKSSNHPPQIINQLITKDNQ